MEDEQRITEVIAPSGSVVEATDLTESKRCLKHELHHVSIALDGIHVTSVTEFLGTVKAESRARRVRTGTFLASVG